MSENVGTSGSCSVIEQFTTATQDRRKRNAESDIDNLLSHDTQSCDPISNGENGLNGKRKRWKHVPKTKRNVPIISRVHPVTASSASTKISEPRVNPFDVRPRQPVHFSHCEFSYAAPDFEVIGNDDVDFDSSYSLGDNGVDSDPDIIIGAYEPSETQIPRIVEVSSAKTLDEKSKSSCKIPKTAKTVLSDEIEAACPSPIRQITQSRKKSQTPTNLPELKNVIPFWKRELDKLFDFQRHMIKDQAKSVELLYNSRKADIEAMSRSEKISLSMEKSEIDDMRARLNKELQELKEKQSTAQQCLNRSEMESKRLERSICRSRRLAMLSLKKSGPVGQKLAYRLRRQSFYQLTRDRWHRKCLLAFGTCLAMLVDEQENTNATQDFANELTPTPVMSVSTETEEDEPADDASVRFLQLQRSILRRQKHLLEQLENDIDSQLQFEKRFKKLLQSEKEDVRKAHDAECEAALKYHYPKDLRHSLEKALGDKLMTKLRRIELLSRNGSLKFRETFFMRCLKSIHDMEELTPRLRSTIIDFAVNQKDMSRPVQLQLSKTTSVSDKIEEIREKMADIRMKKKEIAMSTVTTKLNILSFEERKLRYRLRTLVKSRTRQRGTEKDEINSNNTNVIPERVVISDDENDDGDSCDDETETGDEDESKVLQMVIDEEKSYLRNHHECPDPPELQVVKRKRGRSTKFIPADAANTHKSPPKRKTTKPSSRSSKPKRNAPGPEKKTALSLIKSIDPSTLVSTSLETSSTQPTVSSVNAPGPEKETVPSSTQSTQPFASASTTQETSSTQPTVSSVNVLPQQIETLALLTITSLYVPQVSEVQPSSSLQLVAAQNVEPRQAEVVPQPIRPSVSDENRLGVRVILPKPAEDNKGVDHVNNADVTVISDDEDGMMELEISTPRIGVTKKNVVSTESFCENLLSKHNSDELNCGVDTEDSPPNAPNVQVQEVIDICDSDDNSSNHETHRIESQDEETMHSRVSSNFPAGSDLSPVRQFLFDIGLALVRNEYCSLVVTEEAGDPFVEESVRFLSCNRPVFKCNHCFYQASSRLDLRHHHDSVHWGSVNPFPGPLRPIPKIQVGVCRFNKDFDCWEKLYECIWCNDFSFWQADASDSVRSEVIIHSKYCSSAFHGPTLLAPSLRHQSFIVDGLCNSWSSICGPASARRVGSSWSCEKCEKVFPNVQSAYRHMKFVHRISVDLKPWFRCRVCRISFATAEGMCNHVIPRIDVNTQNSVPDSYACPFRLRCPICPRLVLSLRSWPMHFLVCHGDSFVRRVESCVCPLCYPIGRFHNKQLPSMSHLSEHMLRWHNFNIPLDSELFRCCDIDLSGEVVPEDVAADPPALIQMFGVPAEHCSVCGVRVLLHQMMKHLLRMHTRCLEIRIEHCDRNLISPISVSVSRVALNVDEQ